MSAQHAGPIPRHAEARVRTALRDTRIVALVGPRQSGKTTLARMIARDEGLAFVTLDDPQSRAFAIEDPIGFMRGLDRAVIDEIQRAPTLILALKKIVDEDTRPGRFLITGSVALFESALSPDSLAGRVEAIELLPFSQAEIGRGPPSRFLGRAFAAEFPAFAETGPTPDLVARVCAGGYPEALARPSGPRRQDWLLAYAEALATRDVAELAEVQKPAALARLLDLVAVTAGGVVNLASLASAVGVDAKTVDRWLSLLQQMFVVRRIPAWHGNALKRLTKAPKLHFLDSGLVTALRYITREEVAADRGKFGALLEGFVYSELAKLTDRGGRAPRIGHYRDHDGVEVDFVLERAGRLVGIEVKAGATIRPDDLRGLRRLDETAGAGFACGIVLYDGDRVQRLGERMFALPIGELWAA